MWRICAGPGGALSGLPLAPEFDWT